MKLKIISNNYSKKIIDSNIKERIHKIHESLFNSDEKFGKTWVKYPLNYNKDEFYRIHQYADEINKSNSYLLVIGIGGSYLGAKAGIDMLSSTSSKVIFVGTNLDYVYLKEQLDFLEDKEVYVNVISKSGTTVEILSTYNVVKKFLKKKYGKEYKNRLIFTTDLNNGYLRKIANKDKIKTLSVPDDMGGRFSVLSSVGMLPFAVAHINIDDILKGSLDAYKDLKGINNIAIDYAIYRYNMYSKFNKSLELVATFDYKLSSIPYWIQQLLCESEGKENKGLFVTPLYFSRDLHSVGQFIQQGLNSFIETFIKVQNKNIDYKLTTIEKDSPIKFLENKSFNDLNDAAFNGTLKAHKDANVDIAIISIDKVDEYNFGYLIYFYELACAYSAYLLELNPFDQPGVEQYKAYMKQILK